MIWLQKVNNYFTHYVISFFELQFVISLMSLPLLIIWGIPISIMSPLANFIFTPLLILFLWISCMATTCSLVGSSCTIFERILDAITNLWLHLLSFSRPEWLLGFPCNMLWLSITTCILIVGLYTYVRPTAKCSTAILCLTWCGLILIRPCFGPTESLKKIGALPLWLTKIHHKTYLIDHGALCNRKNRFTNFDYTVLPELIRHTGHTTVDSVIFCKPSNKIATVAKLCHEQLGCKTIMVTPKAECYKKVEEQFKGSDVAVIKLHPKIKKLNLIKHKEA